MPAQLALLIDFLTLFFRGLSRISPFLITGRLNLQRLSAHGSFDWPLFIGLPIADLAAPCWSDCPLQ